MDPSTEYPLLYRTVCRNATAVNAIGKQRSIGLSYATDVTVKSFVSIQFGCEHLFVAGLTRILTFVTFKLKLSLILLILSLVSVYISNIYLYGSMNIFIHNAILKDFYITGLLLLFSTVLQV